jgi:hypothetical protein
MLHNCMDIVVTVLDRVALRSTAHCSEGTCIVCCKVVPLASTAKGRTIKRDLLPGCGLRSLLVVETIHHIDLLVTVALCKHS